MTGKRVLTFRQLRAEKGIPYSRVHVDRLEKAGNFPRRIKLGANSVAWFEDEVDAWLEERRAKRDAKHAPEAA